MENENQYKSFHTPDDNRMEHGTPYGSEEYNFDGNDPYRNYRQREEPKSGLAIASLVLGIISLILFCSFINIPLAILSIVFGAVALSRNTRKGMAIAGLVTSIISIVLLIIVCGTVGSLVTQMLTPGTGWNQIYEGIQDGTYDYDDVYDDIYNDIYNDIYDDHDNYDNYNDVPDGPFGDI